MRRRLREAYFSMETGADGNITTIMRDISEDGELSVHEIEAMISVAAGALLRAKCDCACCAAARVKAKAIVEMYAERRIVTNAQGHVLN